MINLPTKILLAIKPMRTQFKFTLRFICTPEYKYTPEYIYTRVFFAHANWTLLYWKYYSIMGRKCLRKRNNLDSLCYLHSINAQFLHCLHLSISQLSKRYRRKLEFLISTLDRIPLCVTRSFICLYVKQYHVFLSCDKGHHKFEKLKMNNKE